jgi:hypothetical protein
MEGREDGRKEGCTGVWMDGYGFGGTRWWMDGFRR